MISFVQPLMLFAAAAIAIPLIIHFLSRKKPQTLAFSFVHFLAPHTLRAASRIHLLYTVLLFLRIAIILALTLFFAQPVCNNQKSLLNPLPQALYIWIDPSWSMDYMHKGTSLQLAARQAADSLIERMGGSGVVRVYNHSVNRFAQQEGLLADTTINPLVRKSVDLAPALKQFSESLHQMRLSNRGTPLFCIFTDQQESSSDTWLSSALKKVVADSNLATHTALISLTPNNIQNASIVPDTTLPGIAYRTIIQGSFPDSLPLTIFLDGAATQRLKISGSHPTGSQQVTLPNQQSTCVAELSIDAKDNYQWDNALAYAGSRAQTNTVCIAGDSQDLFPLFMAVQSLRIRHDIDSVCFKAPYEITNEYLDYADLLILELKQIPLWVEQLLTQKKFAGKKTILSPGTLSRISQKSIGSQQKTLKSTPSPLRATMLENGVECILSTHELGLSDSAKFCFDPKYLIYIDSLLNTLFRTSSEDFWVTGEPHPNPLGSPVSLYTHTQLPYTQWKTPLVSIVDPGLYYYTTSESVKKWIAVRIPTSERSLAYIKAASILDPSQCYTLASMHKQLTSTSTRTLELCSILLLIMLLLTESTVILLRKRISYTKNVQGCH